MSNKTYSVNVTVRAIIKAKSQQQAEDFIAELLLKQPNIEEYYNLQSREGAWSALYVGDETDAHVWRPTTNNEGLKS